MNTYYDSLRKSVPGQAGAVAGSALVGNFASICTEGPREHVVHLIENDAENKIIGDAYYDWFYPLVN